MKTADARSVYFQIALSVFLIAVSGCAPADSGQGAQMLADEELTDASSIYIESEKYELKTVVAKPSTDATAPLSESPAKPKPKPKRKPLDVDFILKRSKDISVGVAMPDGFSSSSRTQNEEQSFVPASIVKLITTAVALKVLGPDFRFSTRLIFDLDSQGQASNVALLADGDPTVGLTSHQAGAPNRMREMASLLKSRGVRKIVGEIQFISHDVRWDHPTIAAGVPDEDVRECYGAFASSFNFRGNCALASVYSNRGFKWEGVGIDGFISSNIATSAGPSNSVSLKPVISPERTLRGYVLSGTYRVKEPRVLRVRLPIGNGAGFYANRFLAAVKSAGLDVSQATVGISLSPEVRNQALGRFLSGNSSASATELRFNSAPLTDIVAATNKSSDNFFADALFRTLGAREKAAGGLNALGKNIASGFLNRWMLADGNPGWSQDFFLEEGAGLSVNNRATPRALLAFLRQLTNESIFDHFWNSLSVVGRDGTLGDRMRNTRAMGRVRGKTGTLKGTYQVAGYVQKKSSSAATGQDSYVPFVILTATTAKNRGLVRRFQDALIVKIVEAVDRGENPGAVTAAASKD